MRIAYALVVVLAACGNSPDMFPVGGGSGTDGGPVVDSHLVDSRLVDAKLVDAKPLAIDAALFNGRVCLLMDPRDFNSCASTGANGLTVHIGANAAVTAADGTFTIVAGTGAWSVTGSNIVSSYKVKNDYYIPAMTHTMYDALISANGVNCGVGQPGLCQGEGSLMLHVIHNGLGFAGSTASSTLPPNPARYEPFYDNNGSANTWNTGSAAVTGSKGAVWLAGYDVGDSSAIAVTPPSASGLAPANESGQPINDQAITWLDVIIN